MTITVTAPNGASVQFPDGTDHDTINGVMSQNFHPDNANTPNPIGDDRAATVAGLRGIPLAGAYVDKGAAMLNAAAQPWLETGLSHADTYADRLAENEKSIKSGADKYETDHPIETGISKTAVGAGALAPLGATALGARAMGMAGEALLPSIAKGAASFGALNAADAGLRGDSVGKGLVTGALGGAAGPLAGRAIEGLANGASAVAAPIISNIRARVNPEGYAQSQIARAVAESGQTPAALGQAVADANAEGTPLTLADALGSPGQRMLSTVTRAPGEGRTQAVNFLDARQAGQGRRVAGALAEGFDAPETAAQTEARLTAARGTQADADYSDVRDNANPVDVSNVLDHIDQHLAPYGVAHDRPGMDGITGRMQAYRRMLGGDATNLDGSAAGGVNDFSAAQMVRNDLSDEIQRARVSNEGNKARLLGGVLRQLDTSLENSSSGFRQANANFAQASRNIDSVQAGRNAAMRGRTEDTIPAFRGLPAEGQQAFRSGYVDPLIADAQKGAFGANKARPLLSDAVNDEAAAIAPGNPLMQRRLNHENTMFETRAQATGGSRTADNLNDHAAMGVDPHMIGQILTGNWHGAVGSALRAGHNALTGNTPAVREAVGRILLDRGVNPANLQNAIGQTVQRIQFIQNLTRNVSRGASSGMVIAGPSHRQNQ